MAMSAQGDDQPQEHLWLAITRTLRTDTVATTVFPRGKGSRMKWRPSKGDVYFAEARSLPVHSPASTPAPWEKAVIVCFQWE